MAITVSPSRAFIGPNKGAEYEILNVGYGTIDYFPLVTTTKEYDYLFCASAYGKTGASTFGTMFASQNYANTGVDLFSSIFQNPTVGTSETINTSFNGNKTVQSYIAVGVNADDVGYNVFDANNGTTFSIPKDYKTLIFYAGAGICYYEHIQATSININADRTVIDTRTGKLSDNGHGPYGTSVFLKIFSDVKQGDVITINVSTVSTRCLWIGIN